MATPVYIYKGFEVSFRNEDGSVMINATEMAKAFGKQPSDWTKTKQAQEFIYSLSAVRNIIGTELIRVIQGGNIQGTWMHEDVAIEFARWLSPEFAIWCNDRIKELMKVGMTALPQTVEAMLANPDLIIGLATQLKEERQRSEALAQDVVQLGARTLEQEKALEAAAPKVLFADTVTASSDSILIGELAKIICQKGVEIGQQRLFAWMRNNGYLCSRPGEFYNRPAQRYIEQGLFEIKKGSVTHSNGTVLVTTTPMVTGKGQIYFVQKFLYQKK